MAGMDASKERAYWRLRVDINVHWSIILIFSVVWLAFPKAKVLLMSHYFIEIMGFCLLTALFKELLIRRPDGRMGERFWIFSVIDVVIISLIFSFGYPFATFAIMLYLIVLLSTMFETVPGELVGTTVLCLSGYLMNTVILWPQDLAHCRAAGYDMGIPIAIDLIGLLTMLLFVWLARWISGFDKEITCRLNDALQQKDESLDKLAKTHSVLEEKYVESYTLNLVQENIFQELDRVKVLENAADILMGVLGGKACLIYLTFPKENLLKCMVRSGSAESCGFAEQYKFDEEGSVPSLWRQGLLFQEGALLPEEQVRLQQCGIRSMLFVPMAGRERARGLIILAHEWKDAFSPERKTLVNLIAHQLGLALDNSELHLQMKELATHDPLTGLFNRHFLNSYVNDLNEQIKDKPSFTLACVILDVDHFKRINDTYGHLTGDAVLRKLAEIIQEEAAGKFSARYGGEEFVILSEHGLYETVQMAELLRGKVQETQFSSVTGETIHVTISGGVAAIPEHASNILSMLDEADKALYRAKNSGRNRIIACEQGD